MSIQKKSLISTLKTTKKANAASAPLATVEAGTSEKALGKKQYGQAFAKKVHGQAFAKKVHGQAFAKK